jgi:hypothetical protein
MKCSALARTASRPLLVFSISPTTDAYLPCLSALSAAFSVLRHIAVRCIAHATIEWVAPLLNLQKSLYDPLTVVASIHCAERRQETSRCCVLCFVVVCCGVMCCVVVCELCCGV